jgi:hypothetical protein
MPERPCQRAGCSNTVTPPFRRYCSDACRDTAQRARLKASMEGFTFFKGQARKTFRMYDYRDPTPPTD